VTTRRDLSASLRRLGGISLPFQRLLVGVVAITLVVAFRTGLDLVLRGIPSQSFAGRLVAQVDLG
jgi:hypothetical protein